MKLVTKTFTLISIIFCTIFFSSANAGIIWDWRIDEGDTFLKGTFTTDGLLDNGLADAASYVISDFSFDSASDSLGLSEFFGSISAGKYFISQNDAGFVWNGEYVTQYYRENGTYTNGLTIGEITETNAVGMYIDSNSFSFGIDSFRIGYYMSTTFYENYDFGVSVSARENTVSVAEPGTLALLSLCLVLFCTRRLNLSRHNEH